MQKLCHFLTIRPTLIKVLSNWKWQCILLCFGSVHKHTDAHIKQDGDTLAVSSQASWANKLQVIRKSLLTSQAQRSLITKTWNSNVTQRWDNWSFCRHSTWLSSDGRMQTKKLKYHTKLFLDLKHHVKEQRQHRSFFCMHNMTNTSVLQFTWQHTSTHNKGCLTVKVLIM